MFCRNCGNEMADKAAVCVKCGMRSGTGNSFCPSCGGHTAPGAAVCLNCGVSLSGGAGGERKSKMAAGLLGIFLGGLGIHNFYLGKTKKAVIQLVLSLTVGIFTMGLPALWGFIEGVMILCGKISTDAKGNPLE